MAFKDDLLSEKDSETVTDTEGDSQYDAEVIDAVKFDDPNQHDNPEEEAKTIETEETVEELARKNQGEEIYNEPEE